MPEPVILGGWPGFALPQLGDVLDGVGAFPLEETVLDVTHHDAPDRRLATDGIAVVQRSDEGWSIEVPGLRVIDLPGGAGEPPRSLVPLLAAHMRGAPLVPVARVRTRRRGVELRDRNGHCVGRVADDEVSVLDDDRVAARFRELVISGETQDVLSSVERALRSAGATDPDPVPRLDRALGTATPLPEAPGPASSAAELLGHRMAEIRRRWLRDDFGLRTGLIGPARFARHPGGLRSLVRAARPLLDRGWCDRFDALVLPVDELARAAGLASRRSSFVESACRRLASPDLEAGAHLASRAASATATALERLQGHLDSPDYVSCLDSLVDATNGPWFEPDAHGAGAVLLPRLAAELFGAWRQSADALDVDDADRLTRTSARIWRLAAIASAAAPAADGAGRQASRLRAAARLLDDIVGFGEAAGWLRFEVDRGVGAREALAAGMVIARLDAGRVELIDAWPELWRRASRHRVRAWLSS